jgi:hypothetical protein
LVSWSRQREWREFAAHAILFIEEMQESWAIAKQFGMGAFRDELPFAHQHDVVELLQQVQVILPQHHHQTTSPHGRSDIVRALRYR